MKSKGVCCGKCSRWRKKVKGRIGYCSHYGVNKRYSDVCVGNFQYRNVLTRFWHRAYSGRG